MIKSIDSILDFWFSDNFKKYWFNSTAALDQEIKVLFESTYQAAVDGQLDDWMTLPTGSLALILLFDQFPLHMYRGEKESFATERQSRDVATVVITNSFDKKLSNLKKVFCYMPFMHSEDINDQAMAIELYSKAGLTDNLRFAKHHYDLVARFGRFPHRNNILGRTNTAEEEHYLQSKNAFLG